MRKELPPEKEFHNTAYSDLYLFEGSIDKIVIDTENDSFSSPKPGQEVRQQITIHPGSAALTRYYLDESLINCTREMRRYRGMFNEKMMYYVAEYFRHSHDEMVIDGVAKWKIELTNTDGKMWSFSGPVCDEIKVAEVNLSALVRAYLKIPELWMFDFKVGDDVFIKRTIDDFTNDKGQPPMVYLAETEHFTIYEEKEEERGDTGIPRYVVENKLGNAFCFCSADVSHLITRYCYGEDAVDEIVEKAIIYDCLKDKIEMSYESDYYTFNERLLKGIEKPVPKCCKSCIYDIKAENGVENNLQCQKHYIQYDFKPFEVMYDIELCGYYKET